MTTWEASVIEKVKQDGKGKLFDPIPKTNFSVHITFPNGVNGKAEWIVKQEGKHETKN